MEASGQVYTPVALTLWKDLPPPYPLHGWLAGSQTLSQRCAPARNPILISRSFTSGGFILNVQNMRGKVKVKLSLEQAVEAHRVVRRRGCSFF
jgi:hypothetical protein